MTELNLTPAVRPEVDTAAVTADPTASLHVILDRSFAAFQAATRAVTPVRRDIPTTGICTHSPDVRRSATP